MKKGELWSVELPSTNGHEQAGTRPAAVLADTEVGVAIVVPFTSNLQALRFPYTVEVKPSKENGLNSVSVALVFQIRAIDKKRLKGKIGCLEESSLVTIDKFLKNILGI